MRKKIEIDAAYDRATKVISLSDDRGQLTCNIHFTDGFEQAFDHLVEFLAHFSVVRVSKTSALVSSLSKEAYMIGEEK